LPANSIMIMRPYLEEFEAAKEMSPDTKRITPIANTHSFNELPASINTTINNSIHNLLNF
ncbi:hypothetical protein KAU85_00395, partial [Candidatus Bathyarchaeota archaeon]|nr:hypothetical protein [Candidatus Bathyarchaeota archaeon]